ncbi:sensor histidine kinase [Bacillota bacterium Meth-B3]
MRRIRRTLSGKLILATCLSLVVVLGMAIALMWTLTINLTLDKEQQSMRSYLTNTLFSIDERIKDLGRTSVVAVSDDRVQEILMHLDSYGKRKRLEAADYLQKLFLGTVSSRNEVTALFLFDNHKLIQKYSLASIGIRAGFSVERDEWFLENLKNMPLLPNGTRLMDGRPDSFLVIPTLSNTFDNAYFIVLREINSFSPFQRVGYMMVAARMTTLNKIATNTIDPDARYVLADRQGNVLCESLGRAFYHPLSEAFPLLTGVTPNQPVELPFDGKNCLVLSRASSFSGLTLYVYKPRALINQGATNAVTILVVLSAAAVLLVMLITALLIRKTVRPIATLADAMESFSRTNTRPSVEVDAQDEAKRLTDAFNEMVTTINDLIFSEYEKTIQLQNTRLQQKETQLQYLRSQINPHFLYNTLDTIRIKASINGDEEVSGLIMKLVAFFRFGVGNTDLVVPIRHEVKLMQIYLQLMQCRYPMLRDAYHLDEKLLDALIPSFILQPLVENSLMHGLKAAGYDGEMTLTVRADGHDILIELSDNGIGMPIDLIERFNRPEAPGEERVTRGHIGVRNVQDRLSMYYSEGYGLSYRRNEGRGVTAVLRVSRLVEGEKDHAPADSGKA